MCLTKWRSIVKVRPRRTAEADGPSDVHVSHDARMEMKRETHLTRGDGRVRLDRRVAVPGSAQRMPGCAEADSTWARHLLPIRAVCWLQLRVQRELG